MTSELTFGIVPTFYREVYDILSPNGDLVDKELLKLVFTQSHLSTYVSKQIWECCVGSQNSINRNVVYKVLAFIAFAQDEKIPSENLLESYSDKELPIPKIGDLNNLKNQYIKLKNGQNPNGYGSLTYHDIMSCDFIIIDLVPEKKGLFLKHSEYFISSKKHNSRVNRRYNDFVTFYDLLLNRFPYRLIPKLPPKKIVSDSHFLESRRRALQRWLTIISQHPIISQSPLTVFFLTDTSTDLQQHMKDTFKKQPDEFSSSDLAEKAKELLTADTNLQFGSSREQIHIIWSGVRKLLQICERGAERGRAMAQDAHDLSMCLKELSTEPHEHSQWATGGNTIWRDIKQGFGIIYKEFSSLSANALRAATREEDSACERLYLLSDVLSAHVSLCDRLEKGVLNDHERALQHMVSLKKKQIHSVIKETDPESLDQLESKMMQQSMVVSNMELRNAFSLHCVHMETQLVHIYLELLSSVFNSMVSVQIQSHSELAQVWKLIQPTVTKYLPERNTKT